MDEILKDLPIGSNDTTPDRASAETLLLQHAQQQSFPEEYARLQSGKAIASQSRLMSLTPEFDPALNLIQRWSAAPL